MIQSNGQQNPARDEARATNRSDRAHPPEVQQDECIKRSAKNASAEDQEPRYKRKPRNRKLAQTEHDQSQGMDEVVAHARFKNCQVGGREFASQGMGSESSQRHCKRSQPRTYCRESPHDFIVPDPNLNG